MEWKHYWRTKGRPRQSPPSKRSDEVTKPQVAVGLQTLCTRWSRRSNFLLLVAAGSCQLWHDEMSLWLKMYRREFPKGQSRKKVHFVSYHWLRWNTYLRWEQYLPNWAYKLLIIFKLVNLQSLMVRDISYVLIKLRVTSKKKIFRRGLITFIVILHVIVRRFIAHFIQQIIAVRKWIVLTISPFK